jgi:ABC-type multidrug transport system ATPase subunit
VQQDDVLFATFTVREALTFAARLKLKKSEAEQDSLVEQIILELGMAHIASSRIGDSQHKVLSGGERKRCSIGVELISDPSVILLDEPTSGLDSFKARSICELLHKLARNKGKTIISTIHSPSSEAFFFFDRLILMADGHIVYQGDAKDSIQYFKKIERPVPQFANPADFFMKLLSIKYPKQ